MKVWASITIILSTALLAGTIFFAPVENNVQKIQNNINIFIKKYATTILLLVITPLYLIEIM